MCTIDIYVSEHIILRREEDILIMDLTGRRPIKNLRIQIINLLKRLDPHEKGIINGLLDRIDEVLKK